MSTIRFLVGDAFAHLAELPDASVDLIVTSPPFLALRSYLPDDHPDKALEIGSEPTPAAYLTTLLALTREWRRILTPHGSICVELGDTYAGSGPGSNTGSGLSDARQRARYSGTGPTAAIGPGWPLPKSLCLIPTSYAWALAYGYNPHNPDDRLDPWRIRNLIVWHRPNPPVGALGDKVRPSTSYITTACTSASRWFDLDAERTEHKHGEAIARGSYSHGATGNRRAGGDDQYGDTVRNIDLNPAGAPPLDCWIDGDTWTNTPNPHNAYHDPDAAFDSLPRPDDDALIDGDVWTIPTAPYKGAHYATYPPALPRRLIRLMCPMHVCTTCGEPRRRLTEDNPELAEAKRLVGDKWQSGGLERGLKRPSGADRIDVPGHKLTLGWSDCGHNTWRRGHTLDPFAGSGTTGQAAIDCGRDATLIDLDSRNLDLARQRLGLFLLEAV